MLDALTDSQFFAIILIAFLIWIGMRAIRPRTIRYRQLYILPSVFLAISFNQLFNSYTFSIVGLLAWLVAALSAGVMSWRSAEKTQIQIERKAGRIGLPGTWLTLSLVLVFITARLYFGRQLSVTPQLRSDFAFTAQILAISGVVTGYYLGRSCSFLLRYFRTAA
ncbi:MAG: hypothetical protein ISR45_02550 [Rhodospirillales bacterium]|nr:hypothetical protein [Rhodospirillales bacterium]